MSWGVTLYDDRGHVEVEQTYTHNVNRMIAAAIRAIGEGETEQCSGPLGSAIGPAWWKRLDGLSGPDGAAMLAGIADQLDGNPARYDAMNPENGWGSRAGLVEVLRALVAATPEWPCTWRAEG